MSEYTNKELEDLLDRAEEFGWNYNLYKGGYERTYAELQKESPLGEDFSMIIVFKEEDPVDTFISNLNDYYSDFDPEEHAEMWIENRGKMECRILFRIYLTMQKTLRRKFLV